MIEKSLGRNSSVKVLRQEICEKQLMHLTDKLQSVTIRGTGRTVLPVVYGWNISKGG
jgi:hypothetical protein